MKLYDYKMAPNARRVRVFVAEKGVSIETVAVDLASREQRLDARMRVKGATAISGARALLIYVSLLLEHGVGLA